MRTTLKTNIENENRRFTRMVEFPPATVQPEGWLQRWAQVNASSWLLEYARRKHPNLWGKFWNRNQTARVVFSENNETVILCDYTAYFADDLAHYSALFPQSEIADQADTWFLRLLESQDEDGYIGAFEPQARWQHWLEIFSQALTIEALEYRYEVTRDPALLQACERAARLQMDAWYRADKNVNPGIFSGHGTILIRSLGKLYHLTGDVSYLRFAQDVFKQYGWTNEFLRRREDTPVSQEDPLWGKHDAVGSEHVGLPVMLYEYSGDPALLEASKAAWQIELERHLAIDGSPHGNEAMHFQGPLHNCEHCGAVEWFMTSDALARITGEVEYADAVERVVYNAYPAAKSPDGMMVAYMHTPNQLVASEWSQPHAWASPDWCASRQHYHSAHEPLCCNVNGPRLIPYFIQGMLRRSEEDLVVMYYGPCQAKVTLPGAGELDLRMDTSYPFEDDIRILLGLKQPAAFAIQFRIPGWCSSATLTVNGKLLPAAVQPGQYTRVERVWSPNDVVVLTFHIPIRLSDWKKGEFGLRAAAVAVQRGPLLFALPVQEEWQRFLPPAQSPTQDPDSVVAYRVFPGPEVTWNYALRLDRADYQNDFEFIRLPVPPGAVPWSFAPVGLLVKARRIENWTLSGDPEHPQTPGLPYLPLRLSNEVSELTLVPYGFTHLRITYLPVIEDAG